MRKPKDQQYNGGYETVVWAFGRRVGDEKVVGLQIATGVRYLEAELTADAARRLARKLEQFALWKEKPSFKNPVKGLKMTVLPMKQEH